MGTKRFLAGLLGAVVLTACQAALPGSGGGASSMPIPSDIGVGDRATFVVATPAGLLGLDAKGRPLGRIVALPQGAVPSGPALHPNGRTIFFALSDTRPNVGFGSDIYSVDVDGSNLRRVVERDAPNVFYASPSVDGGGSLYVHRRVAKQDPSDPAMYLQTVDAIERVDPGTGERRKVLDDGAEPAVVPGGKALVYVHMDRGQQDGLWRAAPDGGNAGPLLRTGDRFWWLQAPRVSPTGRELAWSSAGRSNPNSARPATVARAGAGGKLAHLDIPSELYVAPLDGSSLRSIATTRDDVVPAWSPDGTRLAYVVVATFYVVSASSGEVITYTEGVGFSYGDLIWLPR